MRVRTGTRREVVLAREAQRFVVVALEEQAGVVDLEDIDLRQVPVERRGVWDRMQAVERVRDIDEAALDTDRLDRFREGHAARNLLLKEQADHLALPRGLDLLAR